MDTQSGYIPKEIPFTNNTHNPVAFVYWLESITYDAEQTNHTKDSGYTYTSG